MTDFIFALAKSIRGVHILWGNNYPVCDSSSAQYSLSESRGDLEDQNQLL